MKPFKRFENESNLFSRSHKYDTLHLQVTLDKSPCGVEFPVKVDNGVELLEVGRYDSLFSWLVAVDVKGLMQR